MTDHRARAWQAGAGVALICAQLAAAPARAQGLPPSEAAEALAELARQGSAPATSATGAATPAPAAPRQAVQTFVLREIRFEGPSGYLSETDLRAATDPFIGQRLRPAQTARITAAINAAYGARGIDLAQAQVAALDARRGVVTIRLFEARLGQLRYDAGALRSEYLDFRLGLRAGELADTIRIAEMLNRLALTDRLLADASFAPGAQPGETDLAIDFDGGPRSGGVVRLDNYGSPGSGEARLVLSYALANVTGWNDPLAVDLTLSEESRAAALSYSRVVTPGGGRLVVGLWRQDSGAVSGPERDSVSSAMTLSFSQPLVVALDRALSLSVSLDGFDETVETAGLLTADQSGWAALASVAGLRRMASEDGALRAASWSAGLMAGRYDDAVTGRNGIDFTALQATGRLEWQAGPAAYMVLSGALQLPLAGDMPSRGQFTVTDPLSVPGYDISLSEGDGGYWIKAQVEGTQSWGGDGLDLFPYAFAALGEAYDGSLEDGFVGQGVARAMGFGLSGVVFDRMNFDLQAAVPMSEVLGRGGDGDVSVRAAFSVAF